MLVGNPLPESPQTYWRWGLPSLVLAVVTLAAILASQWIVEPGITSKYQRIVEQELGRPGQTPGAMRLAELASQRLMVQYPQAPEYRMLHANVCLRAALLFEERGDEELSDSYRMRGMESIRSASRLAGSDAQTAQAWMLREEILYGRQQNANVQTALSDRIQRSKRLQEALAFDSHDSTLGSLSVQMGHQWNPELGLEFRNEALRFGVAEIRSNLEKCSVEQLASLDGLIAKAWLAEGLASLDPMEAIQTAREAILRHSPQLQNLDGDPSISHRIEAIDAFFRCMVLVSGVQEATTAVISRLDQIPSQEQQLLRHVVIASNLRGLTSSLHYPMGSYASQARSEFLKSALRLGPEHIEISSMLDSYFMGMSDSDIGTYQLLFDRLMLAPNERFVEILKWMKRVVSPGESQASGQEAPLPEFRDDDLESIVGLVGYWISASKRFELEWGLMQRLIDPLVSGFPNSGDLKLARAVLAMNLGRWGMAIEDLEKIQQGNPNNTMVEKLLNQAKLYRDSQTNAEGNQ